MAAILLASFASGAGADTAMSRGEFLYKLSGCENCHTDREHNGARLAGGRRLVTPLGTFHTPNITPDRETGIGRWREADFIRALREGRSPTGANYYPSFPYTSYTQLSDADMKALWAYLRTVPAVHSANTPHELPWYLRFRPLISLWKWLYFTAGAFQPVATQSAAWNRGAYLVRGAAHCGECHTPRNRLGGYRKGELLAGSLAGPEGGVVPNITPDSTFGIGRWKRPELVQYLGSGARPDGDFAGGLMAEVIDNGLKYLPAGDLDAIARYVEAVPAVANPVHKRKKDKQGDSGY